MRRPVVALVAHGIGEYGGMELACAQLLVHLHRQVRFVVVSAELDTGLRPLVERWVRVRTPMHPLPLKFLVFATAAGRAVAGLRADLVHTVGAIVPNPVDLATIHYCHAGHLAATGALAPPDAPLLRRVNTGAARALAIAAEHWSYRPARTHVLGAVSEQVAREVGTHYPRMPCVLTPNGVDIERFRPDADARRSLRAQVGTTDEQVVALFVGGDWNRKGLALVVEAVALARAKGVDLLLWVVGQGDTEPVLPAGGGARRRRGGALLGNPARHPRAVRGGPTSRSPPPSTRPSGWSGWRRRPAGCRS